MWSRLVLPIGGNFQTLKHMNYLLYFRRTLLPSASSGYSICRLSFTQLLTSVIGIPISSYHFGTSSSHRFHGLPLGRFPTGWITSALLWGAVGAILLTCDHHLILFLFAVCCLLCWLHVYSPPNFFVSDLVHSGLSCSFSETYFTPKIPTTLHLVVPIAIAYIHCQMYPHNYVCQIWSRSV